MRRIASILLVLAWGLWFGGLIVLFIAVSSLFTTFASRHDLAGLGASKIFHTFNIYQLILAAIALLAAVGCRPSGGSRSSTALLASLALATAVALIVSVRLTPLIEQLRLDEQTHSPEFAKLHGWSMGLNLLESVFLLVVGLMLPAAVERKP